MNKQAKKSRKTNSMLMETEAFKITLPFDSKIAALIFAPGP
jgi:hypothetical protein